MTPQQQNRFWRLVDVGNPDDCWLWFGCKTRAGYGRVMIGGQRKLAHRWALQLATDQESAGLNALHSCDNPACVNPRHLRWGTQLENINDRVNRCRNGAALGEANGSAKLTDQQVREIRNDWRPSRVISAEYGVSQTMVCKIRTGKAWSHVEELEADQGGKDALPSMFSYAKEKARTLPLGERG